MKVYYMNVKSINADDEKWFKYLSQKRIEKVNRLKKTNKKSQSIGAELLLNYAVNGDIKKNGKVGHRKRRKTLLNAKQGFVCKSITFRRICGMCRT